MVEVGTIVDSMYKVEKVLGSGSQGVIVHVKTITSKIELALKLIKVDSSEKGHLDEILDSLKSEFSITKSLHHKNIIDVYDFGYDKNLDSYYYTMDYLHGVDLNEHVKKNPGKKNFPFLVYQILDGLNYLHSNDVIHFDIKPENIFIIDTNDGPLVKLLDFGLSEIKKFSTETVKIKGTLSYIAPEFFLDQTKISPKIDLFSLGVALINVNDGQHVADSSILTGKNILEAINDQYEITADKLSQFNDPKIKYFLSHLIQKDPGTRISSAIEAISVLNSTFGTSYTMPNTFHTTSFLNNTKFILRDDIYKNILRIHKITNQKEGGKTVFLYGVSGSGKTTILDQVFYNITLSLEKIIRMYLEDNTSEDFLIGKLLLRKAYNNFKDIADIEDEYQRLNEELITISEKEQDYFYIFDDIINFLRKCSDKKKNRLTLIFDNFERYDQESVRFINRLIGFNKEGCLLIIISLTTDRMSPSIEQSYKLIEYDPDIEKIEVPLLSFKETEKAIAYFLGEIGNVPTNFNKLIYDYSSGNFRTLMTYFDSFIQRNVISYVSGVLFFKNNEIFKKILKRGSKKSVKSLIRGLEERDVNVVILLTVTFDKLTIEEIRKFIPLSEFDLKKILSKLVNLGLISGYQNLYKAVKSDVKDYIFSSLKSETLKKYYQMILDLDHDDKFYKSAVRILKYVLHGIDISELSNLNKYVEIMRKKDSNDNLYYLLLNCIKLCKNTEVKFRLELNFAFYLENVDFEKAVKVIKSIGNTFKEEITNVESKLKYIRIKLYLHNEFYYDYNIISFIRKNFKFYKDNLLVDEFYSDMFDVLHKLLSSRKYFSEGKEIIKILEKDFSKDKDISVQYQIILDTIKIVYSVIPWQKHLEERISEYVDIFVVKKIFNNNYFYLLSTLAKFAEREVLEQDYSERLTYGLEVAYKEKDIESMFLILRTLANYYYYTSDYEKALYFENKKIFLSDKLKRPLSLDDLGDVVSTKINLYYPLGEIINLLREVRRQAKETNRLELYIELLTNEFILYHRTGDFKSAKKIIRKAFLYFRHSTEAKLLTNFERVAKYFPEIFTKQEVEDDIKALYDANVLTDDIYSTYKEYLETFYNYNICYRWSPAQMDETLNGKLELETPMMLLHYIKEHKKLPPMDQVMGKIEKRFLNPEITGDYLVYNITRFMLTKDEKLINIILELSKKLHIAGFTMINVYSIIPFMEFALMAKIDKKKIASFVGFYEEIKEYLLVKMDNSQQDLFKTTYFYRRGQKIIQYFNA
ncbi:MAG: serine/threonine-protein kinase [Candidatus Delongbacteria bacterium]|nr:serine/threonine-protein kinase [Candidatus Delongbacteria bacterium]